MSIVTVSTSAQLTAALKVAKAGETIELTAGTYTPITLSGLTLPSNVTITSADLNNKAVLTGVSATLCTGLNFTNLVFSTASTPVGAYGASTTWSYTFNKDTSLSLTNLTVVGDPNGTLANTTSGINIENSKSVSVGNNTFQYLHYGIQQTGNNGISIYNNSFSYLYDDAIRGGGTSNALIQNNTFTSMHMDSTDTDHPDCIQFWTIAGDNASNITITGNTYTRGDGTPVQGVFIEDSIGGLALNNVTISNNSFTGAGYNAITVMGAGDSVNNLTMTNNTVVAYADQPSWITVYDVNQGTVTGNTSMLIKYMGDTGVTSSANITNTPVAVPSASVAQFSASMAAITTGAAMSASAGSASSATAANTMLAVPAMA